MVIVAIPHRPDRGHRDRLFRFLQADYWHGWDVRASDHDGQKFNRAKAVNNALAGDWDVAVIADADTWVPRSQLVAAIDMAVDTGRLVAAHNCVVELDRITTNHILTGRTTLDGSFGAQRVRTRDVETQSSMLAVPRPLWDATGGMDERFESWGGEDNAFWHACRLHAGEPQRIPGNAYHLWHQPSPGKFRGPDYARNLALWQRYQQATTVEELP